MRHRDHALDILRIIACIMVVVMHSPIPSAQANGPFLTALSLFTAPCIGLFFMVSGALLLPVNTDYNTFIKRRLSKVVMPTLIWSAVYIGASAYASGDYSKIWHSLLSLPFSPQGSSVLWFMYTLIGLYLLAPILGTWAATASRKELQTVLALWCVTLCYPIIELFATVNETSTGILYYFNGYAGYFLLGYYLKRFPGAVSTRMALPVAIVGVAILYYTRTRGIEIDFYRMFWYLSIFIAAMCVTVWNTVTAICRHLDTKEKDGGGYLVIYQQIIRHNIRHIPYTYTGDALLAMEFGVDTGHTKLRPTDIGGGGGDAGRKRCGMRAAIPYSAVDGSHSIPAKGKMCQSQWLNTLQLTFTVATISMAICYIIGKALLHFPASRYPVGLDLIYIIIQT